MSARQRRGRKKTYVPKTPQLAAVGSRADAMTASWWSRLFEVVQRFLPHTQEDDVAKLRWIVIFVVMLVVLEFTVIAIVFSTNPPVLQNKNAGQSVPLNTNGTNSGCACNPSNAGGSNLQNTPAIQNKTGLGANGNLQATSPSSQCL